MDSPIPPPPPSPVAAPIPAFTSPALAQNIPISPFPPVTNQNGNKKKLKVIIGIMSLFIVFILGCTTTVMYAYGAFTLGSKDFQETVSNFVQSIPFMPKTPQYVLKSSMLAQENIERFTLDASLAMSSGISGIPGLNSFDMQIKGPIDYSDPKKPIISLNAKLTKDFDMDFRTKDYVAYFRINKFPQFLSAMLVGFGFSDDLQKKFIAKWFYVDTKPLETEARANLDKENDSSETSKVINNTLEALNDPKVRKTITMKSENLDSFSTYHVNFTPTDEVLDMFWKKYIRAQYPKSQELIDTNYKLSSLIGKFTMDSWIDKKTYYVRKTTIYFKIKAQEPSSSLTPSMYESPGMGIMPTQKEDIPVSYVMKLSDFGKVVPFEKPSNATNFEDFFKEVMTNAAAERDSLYSPPTSAFAQASNTKRRSDVNAILNAVDQYMADNKGILPVTISATSQPISSRGVNLCSVLVPEYLAALPVDPLTNNGTPVSKCFSSYTTGYTISRSGRYLTVSAPNAENGEIISVTR